MTNSTNPITTTTSTPKVWFITGVAAGSLGHFISLSALSRSDIVIGTSRTPQTTISPLLLSHPNFTPFSLDLFSDESALAKTIHSVVAVHGHIDYVIHTAGGGLAGAIEEISSTQLQNHFQLNVFSHVSITRLILPYMRARGKGGVICFVGSVAGWPYNAGSSGWGAYCAGKLALVGIVKALREEVSNWGITVTLCEPGYFRTSVLSSSSPGRGIALGELRGTIEDYKEWMEKFYPVLEAIDGNQPGNPEKGGERIVQVLKMEGDEWKKEAEEIPARWGIGDDFVPWVENFLKEEQENVKKWGSLSKGVSF